MRAFVMVLAVALLSTGCSPVDVAANNPVSVDVTQGRTDRDSRTVVMDVTNHGDSPIELVSAELDTPQFADPAVWTRGTTLRPGATVSLRAPLADPVCPAAVDPEPSVTVVFSLAGAEQTVTLAPTQSTGVLAIIAKDDCIGVLAARIADVTVAESPRWTPGAHEPVLVDLIITPTGEDGLLELVSARSTNLLSLVDDTGANVEELPLGLVLTAGSPAVRTTLRFVPSRCDPHAIAEDKRGTIMVVDVRADSSSGTAYFRSSDDAKASLYAYVADYCG